MALLQIWLSVPAVAAFLLAIRFLCRKRRLALPPLWLPLIAVVVRALVATLPLGGLAEPQRVLLSLADDLLVAFTGLRLLVWLALEVPAGLGWWRKPPELLVQLLTLGGSAVAAAVILRQGARLDLLSLITTSAVLTAVVGLASQEALKDLISGLELQLSDDFCIGDWIELAGGESGIVTSITWRDCTLRSFDDVLLVVPNSKITAEVLGNRSHFGRCAQRIRVGLDYSYPPAQAMHLLGELVSSHPAVLSDPQPRVRLADFDDSAITYEIQVWIRTPGLRAQLDLRSDLLCQIWYALRREGQSIPFPVRQLEARPLPAEDPTADRDVVTSGTDALRSNPLFADLSEAQRLGLVTSAQAISFGPGEVIVRESAAGDSLFVVLDGRVEVSKRVEDRQRVVCQLGTNDVFGEMTLFLDAPRSASVTALQECRLLQIGRQAIQTLLENDPALLERFAGLVTARQAELMDLGREEEKGQKQGLLAVMKRLFSTVGAS
ncbi:MAG: mechanosensitive ion channel family protein [Cyanobacteriota bacterium]|nr:mechanosensitive ion channel family protein [Cyanobacteriota bacterium]